MKFLTPLFILSALVSCGPAPEIEKRAPLFSTEEKLVVLSEKADKEVIISKYKNSIKLRCNFIIDDKADASVSLDNSFFFSINLAAEEKPINLSVSKNGQKFTVGFRVKQFDILPENPIIHPDGSIELMKQTPMVELLVRGREVKGKNDKKYDRSVFINEKQPVILIDLFPKKYPHIVKCALETVIPEEYADQYVITPPVVETPVVE